MTMLQLTWQSAANNNNNHKSTRNVGWWILLVWSATSDGATAFLTNQVSASTSSRRLQRLPPLIGTTTQQQQHQSTSALSFRYWDNHRDDSPQEQGTHKEEKKPKNEAQVRTRDNQGLVEERDDEDASLFGVSAGRWRNQTMSQAFFVKQGFETTSPPQVLPSSKSFFLFTEFLNMEAFLRIAKNVGGNTTMAWKKHVLDRVEELIGATTNSADLAAFVHWATEIMVSSTNHPKSNEARDFATQLLSVTDGLLSQGYVKGDPLAGKEEAILQDMHASDNTDHAAIPKIKTPQALFDSSKSAVELNDWSTYLDDVNTMSQMASIIYLDPANQVSKMVARGQSLVAEGVTAHVRWLVTDSLVHNNDQHSSSSSSNTNKNRPKTRLVRTITIRGFDASDETVNREELFSTICCKAQPELLRPNIKNKNLKVLVHSGMLQTAQLLYQDLKRYMVDWLSPDTQLVLVGHSIGGALSTLLLFLLSIDQGAEFCKQRIQKVYTFGAPPVASVVVEGSSNRPRQTTDVKSQQAEPDTNEEFLQKYPCDILSAFGLPSHLVHGYVQPWDPIPRLFSKDDPLYPLIGDIDMNNGDDGMTVWPRGPPRTLRPVVNAMIEAWGDGWPKFRDEFRKNCNQTYSSVGVQHLFLPEPTRYLMDRFISVDIAVPPIQTILRMSSADLSPALVKAFPLDTFRISHVPAAIRSFVHHFYPAYSEPLQDYVKRLNKAEETRRRRTKSDMMMEEEDRPCFVLDNTDDDATQLFLASLQQKYDLSAPVSTTETVPVENGSAVHMPAEQNGHEDQPSTVRPWRRAAQWFRRTNDLAP